MQRKEEALNMKKFLSVFLTAALAVSMLAGCGSKNETVTAKVIDIDLTNEEYAFGVDKNQKKLSNKRTDRGNVKKVHCLHHKIHDEISWIFILYL